ncbi:MULTISPECIES: Bug family tripartite tricarboxylate transporter substrate binding protein [unclassified Xanthobacter]|uniref:Bug family tripartite tricarboxylate transporter substrate binding protein n=1 Tax=unclassified Xanthobacter TaxID=2623496 RepID=UPI001EE0F569|nr:MULTISPECIES: tripartite tricarboxylate transporter substrate binding protein [unclassified Xanthobacter]
MSVRPTRRSVLLASVLSAGLALPLTSTAWAEWPEKPITVTVGFGAGGTTDIAARAVADVVSRKLGQPVVVENKPGAGGAVAATALTKMPADGYNLVATTSTTITLDPQMTKLAFTPEDFTYVAAVGQFPEAFIALPSKGWKNLSDALAAAKAAGRMNYASSTSLDRMVTAVLGKKVGAQLVPVPTRSGAEVVTQVMGGHVDLGYSSGAYFPQAKAGEVAVMAVLGEKRLAAFPNVPTLKELGYGISSVNLILFVAPKGVPADVAEKLYAAFAAAGTDPSVVALMEKRALANVVETGATLAKTIHSQSADFARLIEEAK